MLLEDKIEIKIDKIEYLGLENSNNPQVRVNLKDSIDDITVDKGKITIITSRTLECVPKCMFNIYTSFIINRFIDPTTEKVNVDTIKSDINKNPNKYIGPAFSLASSIISSLISASGNLPIITPPNFTKNTKKDV